MTSANTTGMNAFTGYNTNTDATQDFLGKYGYKLEGGTATANKQFQVYVSDLSNPRMVVNGSGNVGIGTTTPTSKLHVAGQIKIDDGVNPFTLPASDGTANQVLSTDGAGTVTWVNQSGGAATDASDVGTEAAGRTLVAGDHLKYLRSTSATAVTFTVPPQSSVSWVNNAEIVFEQAGTGQITIAAGSGVTINSSETLKSSSQYSVIALKRVASDTWTLTGERELL